MSLILLIHFQQVRIFFISVSSKSVFFTKLAISFLLTKFARANLEAKFSDVNLLSS